MRISLPLCLGASFLLHAGLMAMSSVWMSGGVSLARENKDGARSDEAELDTIAIYLRVPDQGAGGELGAAGRQAGDNKLTTRDGGSALADNQETAPAAGDDASRAASSTDAARDTPAVPDASTLVADADRIVEAFAHAPRAEPAVPLSNSPLPSSRRPSPQARDAVRTSNALASPDSASAASPSTAGALATGAALSGAVGGAGSGADADASSGAGSGAGSSANSGSGGDGSARSGGGRGGNGTGTAEPGAVLTFGPRPEYPDLSVRHGEEGRVLCELHIDAVGRVTSVDVLESSGHPRLDQAAVDGLAHWRFLPARKDGRAIACRVPHCVTFRLE